MFNKDKFSELLIKARADKNNKEYAELCGVSRAYVSGYINQSIDNPPTPDIIKRLALKAENKVTYEDLMAAAGHIQSPDILVKDKTGNIVSAYDMKRYPNKSASDDSSDLSKRDLKKIEKELESMMESIKSDPDEGFANFDGNSNIDEDDLALLEDAFRTALRVVKKLNKETYTPKKFKKD